MASSFAPVQKFGFGIEIEAVVEPWKVRPEWSNRPQEYFERLAQALRNRGLKAAADSLNSSYRPQHPEHYNKWFITRDGSLQGSGNQVCLEAVSPILQASTQEWENELRLFWEAMRKVFRVQENFTCGSHIHIAPTGRRFSLRELQSLSYAIITHEHLVNALLPPARTNNPYCKPNSIVSTQLQNYFRSGRNRASFTAVREGIKAMRNVCQVWSLMQGTEDQGRYVVWNFKNTAVAGGTGTVEFRGGRHLRGPNRTFWWITFAVAFVSLAFTQDLLTSDIVPLYVQPDDTPGSPMQKQMEKFWGNIKAEADRLRMGDHLPPNWERMKEIPGS